MEIRRLSKGLAALVLAASPATALTLEERGPRTRPSSSSTPGTSGSYMTLYYRF